MWLAASAVMALAGAWAASAHAEQPGAGVQIEAVRVGFAGRYKAGAWTPITVVLRGGAQPVAGRLRLSTPDGEGVASRVTVPPQGEGQLLRLLPGQATEVRACVRFGRVAGWLLVEFLPEAGPPVQRRFTAGKGARADFPPAIELCSLIVVLGADARWVAEAVDNLGSDAGAAPVVVSLSDARQLPDRWYAYEGVDVLAVATSQLEVFVAAGPAAGRVGDERAADERSADERTADKHAADEHTADERAADKRGGDQPAQAFGRAAAADSATLAAALLLRPDDPRMEALARWVRLGGRLLILAGAQTPAVLGGNGPLAALAPGELAEMAVLRDTAPLETYCASPRPVPRGVGSLALPAPRWRSLAGRVEAAHLGLPLVVRSAQGFGQVTLVVADLDQAPWSSWSDRGLLVTRLLDLPAPVEQAAGESSALMHFGYRNMAGQLRSALDQYEGVSAVPFAVVAALVAVYVLLLGPADYLLLRRFARRMEWTWVTFPLLVVIACVAAWGLAGWLKGRQLRVHQAEVIDVDTSTGLVRGTVWTGVFCPRAAQYDFALRPGWPGISAAQTEVLAAWQGLPGSGLGGMNPQAAELPLWPESYDFAPRLDGLRGVPVAAWSTRSLTARWSCPTTTLPAAALVEENGVLQGTISNPLPCPLEGCVLAYEREAYELGDLGPGATCRLQATTSRISLKTWLTGIRMVTSGMEGAPQRATPYDQSSREAAYILRPMLFYAAAGGQAYTGLGNDDYQFVDLSGLLATGRAIFFARLPEQCRAACGSRWLCNGQQVADDRQQWTVLVRFILPVQKSE